MVRLRRAPVPFLAPHVRLKDLQVFDPLDFDYRHGAADWEQTNQHRLPETRMHKTRFSAVLTALGAFRFAIMPRNVSKIMKYVANTIISLGAVACLLVGLYLAVIETPEAASALLGFAFLFVLLLVFRKKS
jgi:hypothetical protein